ncbi:hypothetical protein [Nonomuraea sp. NPDC049784]|uniref:hypothetical protein n=1 Tax=Nonomuraea sp. NPDC049784 TaxID=3154361 RepID=UPI0033E6FB24
MSPSRYGRSTLARTVSPPRRDHHGGSSPAWLHMQAAQLSWEIRNILQLINGMRLNLSEELHVYREACDMLLNAAHATMEARLPLAPAWGSGPPRVRSIFAQAREAGTDPAEVRPDVDLSQPRIDPQIAREVEAAYREDPDPHAQCAGATVKKERCAKTIVKGIGSAHCAVHLAPAERQRRDELRAAEDRRMQAITDALDEHRVELAAAWIARYGTRPHRLEQPAAPSRPRQVAPFDGCSGLTLGEDEQAMLALYDSGWPSLCPRSAEIIRALLDCPRATIGRLAELAAAQAPERWSHGEQWLQSDIWDGIRPPDLALPPLGQVPELDEHPAVQELRRHMNASQGTCEVWQTGFKFLVEACDDPPIDTMADLLAFWQDLGILVPDGHKADATIWRLAALPPSAWRVMYARGRFVPSHVLATALDWLLEGETPQDPDISPSEVFNLLLTSAKPPNPEGSIAPAQAAS